MKERTELAYDDNLGRGLRRARLAAGIGFREAAELANLQFSSIWRFEQGLMYPRGDVLQRLMKLYSANLNIGPDGLMLTWMEAPAEDDAQAQATATGGGA